MSAGGTLINISKDISYVLWRYLQIYSPKEIESVFIEITIPHKPSSLLGTIYKHPSMKLHKLNKFLEPLLTKFKEGKVTFFKGGFNFNLMKYNQNKCNAEFLEHLFSNNFILHTLPSRSTSSSQTLVEALRKRPLATNILKWRDCVCHLFQVLTLLMPTI